MQLGLCPGSRHGRGNMPRGPPSPGEGRNGLGVYPSTPDCLDAVCWGGQAGGRRPPCTVLGWLPIRLALGSGFRASPAGKAMCSSCLHCLRSAVTGGFGRCRGRVGGVWGASLLPHLPQTQPTPVHPLPCSVWRILENGSPQVPSQAAFAWHRSRPPAGPRPRCIGRGGRRLSQGCGQAGMEGAPHAVPGAV